MKNKKLSLKNSNGEQEEREQRSSKMKEIRDTGKVVGLERIAVMAALNITHELLQQKSGKENNTQAWAGKVRTLHDKIEVALSRGRQLEI